METSSEQLLEVDPTVIANKDTEQNTISIDRKYDINLFEKSDTSYWLYEYGDLNDQLYQDKLNYELELDMDKFSSLYMVPEKYEVETEVSQTQYTGFLYFVLVFQILVVCYFVVKIVRGRKKHEISYHSV